jgi:hypothetical protein
MQKKSYQLFLIKKQPVADKKIVSFNFFFVLGRHNSR